MILTQKIILEKIERKEMVISPYNVENVSTASVRLTLDKEIRVFKNKKDALTITEDIDYDKYTKIVDISQGFILKPGQLVLGITVETLTLPSNICGWLNSRTKFARCGLMTHVTSPFIPPGVSCKQVLEIYNASDHPIKLICGEKICQVVFALCLGEATYDGEHKNQML